MHSQLNGTSYIIIMLHMQWPMLKRLLQKWSRTQKEMNVHNKLQKENVLKYAYRTKLKENIFIIRCVYYYTLHIFTGKK